METEIFEKINLAVLNQFPYLQGTQPVLSEMEDGKTLLIYKGHAQTADDHLIPVVLRVISDKSGNILQISSSR